MYISELTMTRIQELERIFEKDIEDYQNKIICREKFIYLIKECNFIEFCYLYQKYIGNIPSVIIIPTINIEEAYNLIETTYKEIDSYNDNLRNKNNAHRNIKKLVQIEKMAQNGKKIKKRQK